MDIAGATAAIISPLKIVIPASDREESLLLLRENIANPLSWSLLFKSDVPQVTYRIRNYVLNGDAKEALRLKESYKDTFALEAVSAAIIAQITITMPGLSDFGNIHWTATAFAYTSLVSGILSTFFSFYVQKILSDLHGPKDVREWLTSPRNKLADRFIDAILPQYRPPRTAGNAANRRDRIPSLTAAATLTAPSRLLSFSIISLFVALGIYLGSVHTAKLGTLKGSNANLAVLLFFIIFSAWAIFEIYLPVNSKHVDQITASLVSNVECDFQLRELGNSRPNIGPTTAVTSSETLETEDIIREALKASIRAQEESLKAQKALLELLDSQSG
ncbi:hypothetical protein K469DRAFT_665261 [Zopfia rhizophila CBS 207.26]|uniref:Uncharacterized protein n=1 Tax=Zopfia rhizophila CBS 207.26 TaxID=1314779 RepID=A0A6A6E549_9PEZI|nr:hypothetical protein K469DRAFT_665261 [Zopfia rhizophila CBS 207.26]